MYKDLFYFSLFIWIIIFSKLKKYELFSHYFFLLILQRKYIRRKYLKTGRTCQDATGDTILASPLEFQVGSLLFFSFLSLA